MACGDSSPTGSSRTSVSPGSATPTRPPRWRAAEAAGDGQDFAGLLDIAAAHRTGAIVIRPMAAGALAGAAPRHPNAGDTGTPLDGGPGYAHDLARAQALAPLVRELGLDSPRSAPGAGRGPDRRAGAARRGEPMTPAHGARAAVEVVRRRPEGGEFASPLGEARGTSEAHSETGVGPHGGGGH